MRKKRYDAAGKAAVGSIDNRAAERNANRTIARAAKIASPKGENT